jgi:hypothetical protein
MAVPRVTPRVSGNIQTNVALIMVMLPTTIPMSSMELFGDTRNGLKAHNFETLVPATLLVAAPPQ